jgi:hypothetical protein
VPTNARDKPHARPEEPRLGRVLRLKERWHRRPEYPEIVGCFEMSEAVLGGARTEEELEGYLERRDRRLG